jgi:hypothetical protein
MTLEDGSDVINSSQLSVHFEENDEDSVEDLMTALDRSIARQQKELTRISMIQQRLRSQFSSTKGKRKLSSGDILEDDDNSVPKAPAFGSILLDPSHITLASIQSSMHQSFVGDLSQPVRHSKPRKGERSLMRKSLLFVLLVVCFWPFVANFTWRAFNTQFKNIALVYR